MAAVAEIDVDLDGARAAVAQAARKCRPLIAPYHDLTIDDLEQQGMLAVVEALPRFDSSRSNIRAFAYSIARRRIMDAIKSRRRDAERQHRAAGVEDVCMGVVDYIEQVEQIRATVARLCPAEQVRMRGRPGLTEQVRITIGLVMLRLGWSARECHDRLATSQALRDAMGVASAPHLTTIHRAVVFAKMINQVGSMMRMAG